MKVFDQFLTKKFLVFVTLWATTQYISCITYGKEYMAKINSLSKEDYDLCTFPNAYLNMIFWSVGVVLGGGVDVSEEKVVVVHR